MAILLSVVEVVITTLQLMFVVAVRFNEDKLETLYSVAERGFTTSEHTFAVTEDGWEKDTGNTPDAVVAKYSTVDTSEDEEENEFAVQTECVTPQGFVAKEKYKRGELPVFKPNDNSILSSCMYLYTEQYAL